MLPFFFERQSHVRAQHNMETGELLGYEFFDCCVSVLSHASAVTS